MKPSEHKELIEKLLREHQEVRVNYTYLKNHTCTCHECERDGIIGAWLEEFGRATIKSYEEFKQLPKGKKKFKLREPNAIMGHDTTVVKATLNPDGAYSYSYTGNGASQTIIMEDEDGNVINPRVNILKY